MTFPPCRGILIRRGLSRSFGGCSARGIREAAKAARSLTWLLFFAARLPICTAFFPGLFLALSTVRALIFCGFPPPLGAFSQKIFPLYNPKKVNPIFFFTPPTRRKKPGRKALAFYFLGGFDTRTFMPSQGGYLLPTPPNATKTLSFCCVRYLFR